MPKAKGKNFVLYVDDSTPKLRTLSDSKKAYAFAKAFKTSNSDPMEGYWVDMVVTDIQGKIDIMDESMELVNET